MSPLKTLFACLVVLLLGFVAAPVMGAFLFMGASFLLPIEESRESVVSSLALGAYCGSLAYFLRRELRFRRLPADTPSPQRRLGQFSLWLVGGLGALIAARAFLGLLLK